MGNKQNKTTKQLGGGSVYVNVVLQKAIQRLLFHMHTYIMVTTICTLTLTHNNIGFFHTCVYIEW